MCPVLSCRITQQEEWLNNQVSAHPSDPFWQVVGLLQAQLDGLYQGYTAAIAAARAAGQEAELLSREDMLFMNSNGEQQDGISTAAEWQSGCGVAVGSCPLGKQQQRPHAQYSACFLGWSTVARCCMSGCLAAGRLFGSKPLLLHVLASPPFPCFALRPPPTLAARV